MKRLLLALLVVALTGGDVLADDAAKFTSPKATTKTLLTFLKNGQLNRVPECFVEPRTEDERNMLLYGLNGDVYLPAVHRALVAKFGEKASPLGSELASFDQQLQVIDSMQETTDGINGRLSIKGFDQGGVAFLRVKDQWKLALMPSFMLQPVPRERLAIAQARRAAYVDTIQDIEQGNFASAQEAMKALEARRAVASRGTGPQLR